MALRDQPYIPLYINDFLTDEKLNECSAESVGVYIKLMCIMHKSEEYGTILLKQKYKQSVDQVLNFATQLARQVTFREVTIKNALDELILEKVIDLDGDRLIQKRMVKDNNISEKRALAGKKGYNTKYKIANAKEQADATKFAEAKVQANSENENEYVNENNISTKEEVIGGEKKKGFRKPSLEEVSSYCQERDNCINPQGFIDYYESNGWKVGKNPMKDWRATIRSWETRDDATKRKREIANVISENGKSEKQEITEIDDSELEELMEKLGERYEKK